MTTEYALAKGQMVYTRRVKLGENEFHEFTAQIPYSFNTNDDYLVSKEIIDRAADDVVAVTLARLGLNTPTEDYGKPGYQLAAEAHGITNPIYHPVAPIAEVVKSFLETTEERTKARRQARKAEKAVAVEPVLAEHVPDQYNEQPAAEVADQDGLVLDEPKPGEIGSPEMTEALAQDQAKLDALLEQSQAASSEFDLDAELASVPDEIDNDKMQTTVTEWVRSNGGQRAVVELKKALMKFAPTITGIPQERRAEFLALLPTLAAA